MVLAYIMGNKSQGKRFMLHVIFIHSVWHKPLITALRTLQQTDLFEFCGQPGLHRVSGQPELQSETLS